jgi:hypothetical protein
MPSGMPKWVGRISMSSLLFLFLGSVLLGFIMLGAHVYVRRLGKPRMSIALVITVAPCLIVLLIGLATDVDLDLVIGFTVATAGIASTYWIVWPRLPS